MLLYLIAMFVMPLACSPIIVRQRGKTRQITLLGIVILGGLAAAYFLSNVEPITEYSPPEVTPNIRQATTDDQLQAATPKLTDHKDYVGSQVCAKCHEAEHGSWHSSYHRTMTQIASPETIKADFDGQEMKLGNTP